MKRALQSVLTLVVLVTISAALGYRIRENIRPLPPDDVVRPAQVPANERAGAEPAPVRYTPPPAERFAEILERPLFLRLRRPVEIDAPVPAAPVRRTLEATLQGVLFSTTGRVALLALPTSPEIVRVAEGDIYQGWRLDEITPDSAMFTRDGEAVTLRLKYKGGD